MVVKYHGGPARPDTDMLWQCVFSHFRVIVGAPEDDSVTQAKVGIEKAGAVYRCQTQMPFRCDQIPFDTSGNLYFENVSVSILPCRRNSPSLKIPLLLVLWVSSQKQEWRGRSHFLLWEGGTSACCVSLQLRWQNNERLKVARKSPRNSITSFLACYM